MLSQLSCTHPKYLFNIKYLSNVHQFVVSVFSWNFVNGNLCFFIHFLETDRERVCRKRELSAMFFVARMAFIKGSMINCININIHRIQDAEFKLKANGGWRKNERGTVTSGEKA